MCPIMQTIAIVKNLEDGTKLTFKFPVCKPLIEKHRRDHGGKIVIEDLKPCLCNFRLNSELASGLWFMNPDYLPDPFPTELLKKIEDVVKNSNFSRLFDEATEESTTEEFQKRLTEFLEENGLLGGDDE